MRLLPGHNLPRKGALLKGHGLRGSEAQLPLLAIENGEIVAYPGPAPVTFELFQPFTGVSAPVTEAAVIAAPVNLLAPSFAGTPGLGETLTPTRGIWLVADAQAATLSHTAEWVSGGAGTGADGFLPYVVAPGDVGQDVLLRETVTYQGGGAVVVDSAPVTIAGANLIDMTAAPTVALNFDDIGVVGTNGRRWRPSVVSAVGGADVYFDTGDLVLGQAYRFTANLTLSVGPNRGGKFLIMGGPANTGTQHVNYLYRYDFTGPGSWPLSYDFTADADGPASVGIFHGYDAPLSEKYIGLEDVTLTEI